MSIVKRNKLPLFLLAVVLMLSVFYVFTPQEDESEVFNPNLDTQEEYAVFAERRLDMLEERNMLILSKETAIASGELTSLEISLLVDEINELTNLSSSEISIENSVGELGYNSVFVCIDDTLVDVFVYAEKISSEEFINICMVVYNIVDNNNLRIAVSPVCD